MKKNQSRYKIIKKVINEGEWERGGEWTEEWERENVSILI